MGWDQVRELDYTVCPAISNPLSSAESMWLTGTVFLPSMVLEDTPPLFGEIP